MVAATCDTVRHDGAVVEAAGPRIGWSDLPADVRGAVEALLGGPVVQAVGQRGGFSPGTADRVLTRDGRRAFVKAVHPGLDAFAAGLHRRELALTAHLPSWVPAPRLLGGWDEGDDGWVVLVLEDVEGVQPSVPWRAHELDAVLAVLRDLSGSPVPGALASALPSLASDLVPAFGGWERLAVDPPVGLDAWAGAHLGDLVARAARAAAAADGDRLVHGDARSDNLLLRPDGGVAVVDWPSASVGCAWFDTLCVLVDVRLRDAAREHDVEALLAPSAAGVDPEQVTAVLAGMAGYFVDASRLPAPPALPTLRAFQAAEGAAALGWLRERLGDPAAREGTADLAR